MQKPSYKDIFLAYTVDYLIGIAALVFYIVCFFVFMSVFNINSQNLAFLICIVIGAVLWWILFLLYYAILENRTGASIGKKLFHIFVVSKKIEPQRPTFGRLMVAYFIDSLLAGIVGQMSQRFTMMVLTSFNVPKMFVVLCGMFVAIFMWIFYFAFCEYKDGCTPGKKLMGLKVVQDASANKTK